MGAIAGVVGVAHGGYGDPVGRALALLAPRGPGLGIRADAKLGTHPVVLGMRRILGSEEARGGHTLDHDTQGLLAFDGEIHNEQSLRARLEAEGIQVPSAHPEALFAALLTWGGAEALVHVEGSYAFAWLPGAKGPLLLGRDPLGKRPLVYGRRGDTVFFASTLDGLLAMHPLARKADLGVLTSLLRDGTVPGRRTAVENVLRVAPGEVVGIDARLGALSFHIPTPQPVVRKREALPLLDALRLSVVERMQAAHGHAGLFLSGGLDSALIGALGRELGEVPAWSLTFPGHQSVDEGQRARRIGAHLGLEHTLVPCPADPTPWVLGASRAFDEPCPDLAVIPAWGLARAASRTAEAILTGLGGDEVLGGHRRYWLLGHGPWLRHMPPSVHDPVESVLTRRDRGGLRRARRAVRPRGPFQGVLRYQPARVVRGVFGPQLAEIATASPRHVAWDTAATLDQLARRLPPMRMAAQDRAFLAHGLRGRHPFLDNRVRDAVWALEHSDAAGRSHQKNVLRAFIHEVLDPDLARLPRMGFAFPVDDLYRGPLRPLAQDALLGKRTRERGFTAPSGSRRLLRDHITGERNNGPLIHTMVMLELWARRVLDGDR